MTRTEDEVFADRLDCDLYRLIGRVEGRKQKWWRAVATLLRAARPHIRARMCEADRKVTS